MEHKKVTKDDMIEYLEGFSAKRAKTLKVLGKLFPWMTAIIETEPGKTILLDDINRHEELLMKMYTQTLNDQEQAEIAYLKGRIERIADRVKYFRDTERNLIKET